VSQPQTCTACGYSGFDVGPRVVEVEPKRSISVYAHPVPERFRVEVRCVDTEACQDRQLAKEPA